MADPVELVPYGKVTAVALIQQMQARVRRGQETGRPVYVIACVVELNERGNHVYTPYWTTIPREIHAWAAQEIGQHAFDDEP